MENQLSITDFLNEHGIRWTYSTWWLKRNENGELKKKIDFPLVFKRDANGEFYLDDNGEKQLDYRYDAEGELKQLTINSSNLHNIQPYHLIHDKENRDLKPYNNLCILHTNYEVPVLDIDEKEMLDDQDIKELMENRPYYLSVKKKLPHIFLIEDEYKYQKVYKEDFHFGELLSKGYMSISSPDCIVYNPQKMNDKDYLPRQNEIVKKFLDKKEDTNTKKTKTKKTTTTTITKDDILSLIKKLNREKRSSYADWTRIGWILRNEGYEFELFHTISKDYLDKYTGEEDCRRVWNNDNDTDTPISLGTLKMWLNEDNKKEKDSEDNEEEKDSEYETLKKKFEKNHFKVQQPTCFITINEDNTFFIQKENDFVGAYRHLSINVIDEKTDKTRKVRFIKQWLDDDTIRVYKEMVFDPSRKEKKDQFNTFDGFRVENLEKVEIVDITLLLEHIKNRLCDKNNDYYNYFINWLAWIIQKPYEKSRVCPIIKSKEGIGKGLFIDFFGKKIIGEKYYKTTANAKVVLGSFNSFLQNVLLLNFNEVQGKDTFDGKGKLFEMITDETITIEKKGIDAFTQKNHLNMIATTNNDCPFSITATDRRFTGIEPKCEMLNKKETESLVRLLIDDNVAYSFYLHLKEINLENYNAIHDRVKTNFIEDCKQVSASIIFKFLEWYIYDNIHRREKTDHTIKASLLFETYKDWNRDNQYNRNDKTAKRFYLDMKKVECIEQKRSRENSSDYKVYVMRPKIIKEYMVKKGYMEDTEKLLELNTEERGLEEKNDDDW